MSNTFGQLAVLAAVGAVLVLRTAGAADVELKNGMILQGRVQPMQTMTEPAPAARKDELDPEIRARPIVRISSDWQNVFVPFRQVTKFDTEALPPPRERFPIDQKKTGQQSMVGAVSGVSQSEPFNQFGQRSLTFPGAGKPTILIQGITEISSQFVEITSLTHAWKYGVATHTLSAQDLERVLRYDLERRQKLSDPQARLALVRFFAQANLFEQAFAELGAISRDFPDLTPQVESAREVLLQSFGTVVLQELKRRRDSGQHELAVANARKLDRQQLGGAVLAEVQELLDEYARRHETVEKARLFLGDLHGRVDEPLLQERLQSMRSIVNAELSLATLSRLDPFLRSERDTQLEPREKLALAYSGWVLGPADAITELEQAVGLWDARHLVQEYLRSAHPHDQVNLLSELKRIEGIGPAAVASLVPLLPPWLEPPVPDDTGSGLVEVIPAGDNDRGIRYRVILPPEYTPGHRYPLLVVLGPAGRDAAETVRWWGGSPGSPGITQRRGYVVIAPDYVPADQREYAYDIPAHHVVLESLKDARRRFAVDPDRVFLAGHGRGGDAAFDIGFAHPDQFTGILPICGACGDYATYLWENSRHTAWYIVGGELHGDGRYKDFERSNVHQRNNTVLTRCCQQGAHVDLIYVQYVGRGLEMYPDELPRMFDWMEMHKRPAVPKDFQMKSLRQVDQEFFNLRAENLPRTVLLPLPRGVKMSPPMELGVKILPGNAIVLKSPAKTNTVWLNESLIDIEQPVKLPESMRRELVAPELDVLLEDLRMRSDRSRLYSIRLAL